MFALPLITLYHMLPAGCPATDELRKLVPLESLKYFPDAPVKLFHQNVLPDASALSRASVPVDENSVLLVKLADVETLK